MFIEQALKNYHEFWRYLIGLMLIILAVVIGQVPLTIALFLNGSLDPNMDQMEMLNSLDSNYSFFLMLLTFAVGLIGIFFVAKNIHYQSIRSLTTARAKVDWSRIGFGFGIIALISVSTVLIDYFSNPQDYVVNFEPTKFYIMLVIAVIFVPIQTSFEEYLFRGYLMQGFGVLSKTRWLPLIITSVIFGGLHFFNPEVTKLGNIIIIYYIGTGFLLGIMTLMDDGMELALGFHAGNNLITAVLVTADWTAFQTNSLLKDISEPGTGWENVYPILIMYPIILFIMAWKYKWTNWKDKLFGSVKEDTNQDSQISS